MIDRFSLRWRIPAIMALLLIGAVVTLGALAYSAARRSAIEVAQDRLSNAANRISILAASGAANIIRLADSVGSSPSLLAAFRHPGEPLSADAQSALRKLRTDTLLPLKVAVLDAQGRPIEGVAPELAREGPVDEFTAIDTPTVRAFRPVDGMLEYVIAVPVRDSGRVVGQIVQWRRVTRVTQSWRVISDLIGPRARLLLGNTDGTALTEFYDTLRPPVIRDTAATRAARHLNMVASAPIAGTPWSFSVEYPYAVILKPIRLLSGQTVLVALGVMVLAIVAGTLMSRGMTNPLSDLTTTAEFIAAGDLSRRPLATARQDEIGRLARSFGVMADKVHEAHDELERRIEARTADLQTAMTQLRDTQDELVRKEKLATIGQLASSVGHELRNPLGVMANAVYILERTIDSPSPRAQQYLKLLDTQIKLSERIVSDLLDSARSKSPQRRDVDVHTLITEQLSRVAVPSNLHVEVAVEEELPQVHVDPDQIGQIMVNLLTNAAQAMDNQPGMLSIRARDGDGRVHIDVRDTGPGVPPELVDKIFEPLYTTKARGIGLGLSVSRSLATANRGTLTVMNHPGGGAVFTLVLPTSETV